MKKISIFILALTVLGEIGFAHATRVRADAKKNGTSVSVRQTQKIR